MEDLSRRDLLRVATAVAALPLAAQQATQPASGEPAAPLFFTPREFRMVDELSEIIIPADDHSPGARAAKVAAVIDKSLAESFEDKPREEWREGLKVVDELSKDMHDKLFLEATPEQRIEVMEKMAHKEDNPHKPEELFFHRLKGRTALAYYTSKIGIHQEMQYQGNSILEEFAGFDAGLVTIQPGTQAK